MKVKQFFFPICCVLWVTLLPAAGQELQQQIQQKLAGVKASVARSQAALRQYSWTEHTDIVHKGEVKSTRDNLCRYSSDGQVKKTRIGTPPKQKKHHGIRGRIAANKQEVLTDYMERSESLVHHYVPPSTAAMQAAFVAGRVSVGQAGPGQVELQIRDYLKRGDTLVFRFDQPSQALTQVAVDSYLDDPEERVTLDVSFASLPDGTNHVSSTVLNAEAKKIQVKVSNANYQKIAR